jgi:hypothetical protein
MTATWYQGEINRCTSIFHHNKNLPGIKAEKFGAWPGFSPFPARPAGMRDQKEKAGFPRLSPGRGPV